MSRVLLVAYGFPPRAASGVRRAQKLAKYLPGQGWEVTVLTVQDPPAAALDASALAELPEQVRVVRAWSLEPTRLVQAIRRGVRGGAKRTSAGEGSSPRTESEAPSRPVAVASASYSGRSPAFVGAVRFFFLPDEKRGWLRYAVRAALSDTREAPVDAVVSTGPPFTGYLVGDRVAAALDVPHVLDFRDPWVGNHFFVPPTPLHAAWQRRAEARTASRAAALVTVSPAIADDLSRRYPGTRVELIPNGFDPEDLPRAVAPPAGRFVLVHAGTFSGPRSPRAFLEGLVLAERREPALADVAEVRFVGVGAVAERLARQAGVRAAVATTGFVPYPRALEEAASASVNVAILSPGEESRHSVPGKLAEYVGLRRPILLLAGQGAARDVLAGVAGVRAAAPDDPSDIASAVLDLYHAWREGALRRPAEEEAARFSRVETARRYAELLDDVAARAGAEEA